MIQVSEKVRRFFERYEEGANTFDPDIVTAGLASTFMAADPNGAQCISIDDAFLRAIPERKAFFRSIGFLSAAVRGIEERAISPQYTLADVQWEMVFTGPPERHAEPQTFRFFITYVLGDTGDGLRVVCYVSHDDERRLMADAGLIPAEDAGEVAAGRA